MKRIAKALAYLLALLIAIPVAIFATYDLMVFQPQMPEVRRLLERASPDERAPALVVVSAARASVSQHLSAYVARHLMSEINSLPSSDGALRGHFHDVLWWALVALHLSDQEQATLFLSLAYMGSEVRGFSAASQVTFGGSLNSLSVEQAATLAAISRGPTHYLDNPERLARARAAILERMQIVALSR